MQKVHQEPSPPKQEDIESKDFSVDIKTDDLTSENIVEKEKLDSLQNLVNASSKSETKAIDYNNGSNLRSALVNTTLTNLHVLHQYK